MKKYFPGLPSILCLIIPFLLLCSPQQNREGILAYLPETKELGLWKPMGEPQTAAGEDLFLLINGGAEIYHEYGFKRAVFHSYFLNDTISLNVEIYEMEDAAAAYGVYSFKTEKNAEKISIGNEGLLDEYYLNFWKGNFVVTVIGYNSSEKIRKNLVVIAGFIDNKIAETGSRPPLINWIEDTEIVPNRIIYIEGNLGLYNQYKFDTKNIFGVRKGAIADYKNYMIFVFQYTNKDECIKWFKNGLYHLKKNAEFSQFHQHTKGTSLTDDKGKLLFLTTRANTVLIYKGDNDLSGAKKKIHSLKQHITD